MSTRTSSDDCHASGVGPSSPSSPRMFEPRPIAVTNAAIAAGSTSLRRKPFAAAFSIRSVR